VERALASRRIGPYTLQAAIAAGARAGADRGGDRLGQIVALYDVLVRRDPRPWSS
jgi:RNA polymerase sigma-70 factor (ECF subfamily)